MKSVEWARAVAGPRRQDRAPARLAAPGGHGVRHGRHRRSARDRAVRQGGARRAGRAPRRSADRPDRPSGPSGAVVDRRGRRARRGDDRRRTPRQQPGVADARLDGQLRPAPHAPPGRGRARRARRPAPHGSSSASMPTTSTTADSENESVRAVRFAYGLPGVERVRVVHAWFLPALAVGMFADVAADLDAMDAAAAADDRSCASAAAGPAPAGRRGRRRADPRYARVRPDRGVRVRPTW